MIWFIKVEFVRSRIRFGHLADDLKLIESLRGGISASGELNEYTRLIQSCSVEPDANQKLLHVFHFEEPGWSPVKPPIILLIIDQSTSHYSNERPKKKTNTAEKSTKPSIPPCKWTEKLACFCFETVSMQEWNANSHIVRHWLCSLTSSRQLIRFNSQKYANHNSTKWNHSKLRMTTNKAGENEEEEEEEEKRK